MNFEAIYKDETPEGDENHGYHCRAVRDGTIYKDETPEGDENRISDFHSNSPCA